MDIILLVNLTESSPRPCAGIRALAAPKNKKGVDGRVEPGHDETGNRYFYTSRNTVDNDLSA